MPLVHSHTQDLFEESTPSVGAFTQAFDDWLASARAAGTLSQETSVATYRALWGVLAKWCVSQSPRVPLDMTEADLEAFIATRAGAEFAGDDLSPRYVWRLLHLVDRVLAQRARRLGTEPNRAAAHLLASRPEWRYANAARTDALPEFLSPGRAKQLVGFLSEARPRGAAKGPAFSWQELRNRASVGLQLGAGLSPGDVRHVRLDGLTSEGGRLKGVPWKTQVPGDGVSPARETPIATWAGQLLRHWLQVRSDVGVSGPYLFPSTKTGKPWSKVAQYLASKAVLVAAGFSEEEASGGSFRMRHTFALRQLRRGKSEEDVARWLGIVDPAVMARYRRVVHAPVSDLA
jgi:site-specific recombinase XerD